MSAVLDNRGLYRRVQQLDPLKLSSLEVRKLSREIRDANTMPDVRIAFAGNIVFEPLPEFAEVHLACQGLTAVSHVAPYGQALQELLNPDSDLRRFEPNFLMMHFELDALLPGLMYRRNGDGPESWREAVEEVIAAVEPAVRAALEATGAVVLLTNFAGPDCYDLGIADSRSEFGQQEFVSQLNSTLARTFRSEPRVQILDLCRLMAYHGRGRARDRRLYYAAKLPWHESFLPVLADEMVRHVGVALGRIRKCLVVDLDNTLWGGVLGEDGPEGIRVGMGDPVAEAHYDLQRKIHAISKRGVLLAVCSKNNPEDVEEAFSVRTDMPLRREDFVYMDIGWEPKTQGLRRIAERLNIGTDSLVFLDDSPAELELVRQLMPEVECVAVPQDPVLRPTCLDRVHGLDRAIITAEDLVKTSQYQAHARREGSRHQFSDLRDYLVSLETRVVLKPATPDLMARAHQLFSKTNQFNLTTRRYTLAELEQFASDPSSQLLLAHAEDRFGDLGWIGAVLVRRLGEPEAEIDSFVLSCRAMGRGVESAMLNRVKELVFGHPACDHLTAEYVVTRKNRPARDFLDEHGFKVVGRSYDGSKQYTLDRRDSAPTPCGWLTVLASV
jgi:FkbH-like protein